MTAELRFDMNFQSQAKFLKIIPLKRNLAGDKIKVNIALKNVGTESFPINRRELITFKVAWPNSQGQKIARSLSDMDEIKPGESTNIVKDSIMPCSGWGEARIGFIYENGSSEKPIIFYDQEGNEIETTWETKELVKLENGKFVKDKDIYDNAVSKTAICSFWVDLRQYVNTEAGLYLASIGLILTAIRSFFRPRSLCS